MILAELRGFEVYFAVYNLALDSGLRVIESGRLFNSVVAGEVQVERNDGFCVAPLGYFRRTKTAYYGFFTEDTMDLLRRSGRKTCYVAAKSFKRKRERT